MSIENFEYTFGAEGLRCVVSLGSTISGALMSGLVFAAATAGSGLAPTDSFCFDSGSGSFAFSSGFFKAVFVLISFLSSSILFSGVGVVCVYIL